MLSLEQFAEDLRSIDVEDGDYSNALLFGAEQAGEEIAENFRVQRSSDGSSWPEHAPLTVRLYGEHPLLRLTYTMYTAATNNDATGSLRTLEPLRILVGIDGGVIPYAAIQNFGGGNIPQREFYFFTDQAAENIGEIMEDEVFDVLESLLP